MHERWRAEKLAFVEGLEGASLFETVCVCMVIPLAVRTQALLGGPNVFLGVFLPLIVLCDQKVICVSVLLLSTSLCFGGEKKNSKSAIRISRSGLALGTALCILAVDFEAFPRKFAKTESSGFSLMDAGTGCIVVNNAMVSKGGRKWIRLIGLGLARLALVELSRYPSRDEAEYGGRWCNFFFILAILDKCRPSWPLFLVSVTFSTCAKYYQAFGRPARTIFSTTSLPGYVALHCAATLVPSTWQVGILSLAGAGGLGASRKRGDIGYVLFSFGLHALSLEISKGIDTHWHRLHPRSLLSTIDRNHSTFFLLSNLFTGLYNTCINSLSVNTPSLAFLSLILYLFATYLGVVTLFFFRFSIFRQSHRTQLD